MYVQAGPHVVLNIVLYLLIKYMRRSCGPYQPLYACKKPWNQLEEPREKATGSGAISTY